MAIKIGWAVVRANLDQSMAALAARPGIFPHQDHLDVQQHGEWTCMRWMGWDFHRIYSVGQRVSEAGPSIAFFVFEGAWMFRICNRGTVLAEREHYTNPHPTLLGDLAAAESALGIPSGTLEEWNIGDPIGDYKQEDLPFELESFMLEVLEACPTNIGEHDATDEWGFIGLAERLGATWSDDPGMPYTVDIDEPPKMDLPVARQFDPGAFRKAHLGSSLRAKLWVRARRYHLPVGTN